MAKEAPDFQSVFARLKAVLVPCAPSMTVTKDTPSVYYLDTTLIHPKNGKPSFFGAAVINKNYVSFHLFPVYMFPELLEGLSPELRRRMQGKSCFNFKSISDEQVAEMEALVRQGVERFRSEGAARIGA